ncbi:hypothetical protein TRFO_04639 [Tritrichomonas foetus]|uniref:Sulfatase N-terminal domain-containing protein n=1 Tax=Tritrichomonas foetus TaxID=1144522 RepID=A0A1J4KDK7_9EUKA|nr:hypothetical protein TRFO_04639 [Tritrichomonas foetus]|eukprot:OHT09066.1 hypothetical protein TRFO_04639 [Tritrichomonas foetus]
MGKENHGNRVIFYVMLNLVFIVLLDFYIVTHTKNVIEAIYRLTFYLVCYLLIIQLRLHKFMKSIFIILMYTVNVGEAACYFITNHSFSYQFFSSIDIKYGFTDQQSILFFGIITTVIVIFFSLVTIVDVYLEDEFIFLMVIYIFYCMYKYCLSIKKDLFPFSSDVIFHDKEESFIEVFESFLATNITVSQPKGMKQKNLIMIILESFELQNLGPFNREKKDLLPFLSNLSNHSTIFTNVVKQPHSGWSIASLFVVMCNLPMITDGTIKYDQGHFHLNKDFKCFPDYLHKLNYSSYMVIGGRPNIGNYLDFLRLHNYSLIINTVHHKKKDNDVTNWMVNSSFLSHLKSHQPFNLMWYIQDTHISRYRNECRRNNVNRLNGYFNECECTDSYVKKFFDALEKNDLIENSEIVIHGDHSVMSNSVHNFVEPRSLLVNIASRQYGRIEHQMTFYDMAHLYLSLLNVSYSPRFPFGGNPLLSNHIPTYPRKDEFNYLYYRFQQQMKFKEEINEKMFNYTG